MNLLLDATIKLSLILLVALGVTHILSRSSASLRHWVLVTALVCAAASPVVGLVVPVWHVDIGLSSTVRSEAAPQTTNVVAPEVSRLSAVDSQVASASPTVESGGSLTAAREWLFAVWAAGAAACLLALLAGFWRLLWIESRSTQAGAPWAEAANDLARSYHLSREPHLLQSQHPRLLVTWGFWPPRVLLPVGADSWPADRIRSVLSHELAHIRRHDWVVQLGAAVLGCLFWFNPIVWAASRRLREESEQACDDMVLSDGTEAPAYAAHLLDVARRFRQHRAAWFPVPAIVHSSSLERRVRAMLDTHINREPVTPRAAAVVAIAFLAITVPVAGLAAFAQNRFATVSGTAIDQSGAALENATLALVNAQTNTRHEVRSNQSGFFEFVGLTAGDYELEVNLPGFELLQDALSVGVGETLQKNVMLRVGAVQETIRVTARPDGSASSRPRVQTARAPRPRRCPNPVAGGCVGPPVKLKDVRPIYPQALEDSGIEGTVLIEGRIGTDGKMKDMRVVSSPHPAFERSALDAVAQWEFTATTLNEREIDTRINISVSFAQPSR